MDGRHPDQSVLAKPTTRSHPARTGDGGELLIVETENNTLRRCLQCYMPAEHVDNSVLRARTRVPLASSPLREGHFGAGSPGNAVMACFPLSAASQTYPAYCRTSALRHLPSPR